MKICQTDTIRDHSYVTKLFKLINPFESEQIIRFVVKYVDFKGKFVHLGETEFTVWELFRHEPNCKQLIDVNQKKLLIEMTITVIKEKSDETQSGRSEFVGSENKPGGMIGTKRKTWFAPVNTAETGFESSAQYRVNAGNSPQVMNCSPPKCLRMTAHLVERETDVENSTSINNPGIRQNNKAHNEHDSGNSAGKTSDSPHVNLTESDVDFEEIQRVVESNAGPEDDVVKVVLQVGSARSATLAVPALPVEQDLNQGSRSRSDARLRDGFFTCVTHFPFSKVNFSHLLAQFFDH